VCPSPCGTFGRGTAMTNTVAEASRRTCELAHADLSVIGSPRDAEDIRRPSEADGPAFVHRLQEVCRATPRVQERSYRRSRQVRVILVSDRNAARDSVAWR
jgi:hypothetical protein